LLRRGQRLGRQLPVHLAVKIASCLCEGLAYAHRFQDSPGRALNLVHRDISPHNVLISFAGGVKLTDFGIAKAATQSARTKAGVLKGKHNYMSPDQVLELKLDQRSDIFSVGTLLYEMLTGELPFDRRAENEILDAIVRDTPAPVSSLRQGIPPELEEIVQRALHKKRDQRFQDADAMQLALETFFINNKIVCNTGMIGGYVRGLFQEFVEAQQKVEVSGSTSVQDLLSGLVIVGTGRDFTPLASAGHATAHSQPGRPSGQVTVSHPAVQAASAQRAAKPPAPSDRQRKRSKRR
jgi:serine/threonine protein kinase